MIYFLSKQQELFDRDDGISTKVSVQRVKQFLKQHDVISFDIETTGLRHRKDSMIMYQFGDEHNQYVIDARDLSIDVFKQELENPNLLLVGHNIKFDYKFAKQYGVNLNNLYCTMISEMVLTNGKRVGKGKGRLSLAGVYKHYFDIDISKGVRETFPDQDLSKPFSTEQIIYGANDVVYPLHIKKAQEELAEKEDLTACIQLENWAVLPLSDIEFNGIRLDEEKWLANAKLSEEKLFKAEEELDADLLAHTDSNMYKIDQWQPDMFNPDYKPRMCEVNWRSSAQVLSILNDVYNLDPRDRQGKPSTGEKALNYILDPPDIVDKLLKFREQAKIVSTYGKKFIENYLHDDGRVRTVFWQVVETGRVASGDKDQKNAKTPFWNPAPNLQNIPQGDEFRSCFIPEDGYVFVVADYSAQEARIMACHAGDQDYIDFFLNGDGDSHSFTATKLFSAQFHRKFKVTKKKVEIEVKENEKKLFRNKPLHLTPIKEYMWGPLKDAFTDQDSEFLDKYCKWEDNWFTITPPDTLVNNWRHKGKTLNFMISFGGDAPTLAKELKISIREAAELINNFFKAFPKLKRFFENCRKFALSHGYIVTDKIIKRKRWLLPEYDEYIEITGLGADITDEDKDRFRVLEGIIGRAAQNTPVQGTAGNMTKLALVLLRRKLIENGLTHSEARIVNVIHDEIIVECKREHAELVSELLQWSMETAGREYIDKLPFPAQPSVEKSWTK